MKILLLLAIFLSKMMMSSLAYAEWTKVTKHVSRGDTYYIDLERIRKHDGKVYYWYLTDYIKPVVIGVFSFKGYVEAECGPFRLRYLNQKYYTGPMESGEIKYTINSPFKDWQHPIPNSVGEALLKTACNHKSMQ